MAVGVLNYGLDCGNSYCRAPNLVANTETRFSSVIDHSRAVDELQDKETAPMSYQLPVADGVH